jgi:hypothetical protein
MIYLLAIISLRFLCVLGYALSFELTLVRTANDLLSLQLVRCAYSIALTIVHSDGTPLYPSTLYGLAVAKAKANKCIGAISIGTDNGFHLYTYISYYFQFPFHQNI